MPQMQITIPCWARENIIVRFFYVFSKIEYALKTQGFLQNKKDAHADWNGFAKQLDVEFLNKIKESKEAAILFSDPPKKQVNNSGHLAWEKRASPKNSQELFEAIRRVRNNLFHGGKYPFGQLEEPSRNNDLLNACLFVLEEALDTDENVRNRYNEGDGYRN